MSVVQHTNPGKRERRDLIKMVGRRQFCRIAKQFGGFYETGSWRFPSPAKRDEFLQAIAKMGA